jgi:hypothetical protein
MPNGTRQFPTRIVPRRVVLRIRRRPVARIGVYHDRVKVIYRDVDQVSERHDGDSIDERTKSTFVSRVDSLSLRDANRHATTTCNSRGVACGYEDALGTSYSSLYMRLLQHR